MNDKNTNKKQANQTTQQTNPDLQDEPFIGMWENHDSLTDSQIWLRKTRQQEWSKPK